MFIKVIIRGQSTIAHQDFRKEPLVLLPRVHGCRETHDAIEFGVRVRLDHAHLTLPLDKRNRFQLILGIAIELFVIVHVFSPTEYKI